MDVALRVKCRVYAICAVVLCGLIAGESLTAEENPPTLAIQPPKSGQSTKEKKRDEPVTARAYLSVDKLPPGQSCKVIVLVDVREGWHINQNPPQPENLIPTKFSMKSKLRSSLGEIAYPEGKPFRALGSKEPLLIYENQVAIRGVISVPEDAAGQMEEMELTLDYQACNDRECKAPAKIKLGAKIPVARRDETVRQINQNLFRDEKP